MALPTNIIWVGGFEGIRGLFYLLYSVLILTPRLQKPGGGVNSPSTIPFLDDHMNYEVSATQLSGLAKAKQLPDFRHAITRPPPLSLSLLYIRLCICLREF